MDSPTEKNFNTPMMLQYLDIKKKYDDCLLFFRLGDFYELFMKDAEIGSRVLNITLTSRDRGKDGRIPMCGVPYHAVDSYLYKLVRAGYKVAICEQMTEPDKTGIVERDVIRIVTPGTVLDEKSLEQKENNYLVSLSLDDNVLGLAFSDISTGSFYTSEYALGEGRTFEHVLTDELTKFNPSECILNIELYNQPKILKVLKIGGGLGGNINTFLYNDWDFYADRSEKTIKDHFGIRDLDAYGIKGKNQALRASASLLGYLKYTQKDKVGHIQKIQYYANDSYVGLDRSTILNLELFTTIREGGRKGSLIHVLDHTLTPMGGRLLRHWLLKPLTDKGEILKRYDAVSEFFTKGEKSDELREVFKTFADIERLLSRISVGIGNPRDLINLQTTLARVIGLVGLLKIFDADSVKDVAGLISDAITKLENNIKTTIVDEPPLDPKIGNFIKPGINPELDKLKTQLYSSKTGIAELETKERERSGISSLKIKFNQVFGYYIEITKANLDSVPSDYLRKQTLVNAERFTTPELKSFEETILTAEEKMKDMEYEIFLKCVTEVVNSTQDLQNLSGGIAVLDCLLNFAHLAQSRKYCRPELIDTGELILKQSRHPVVEQLLDAGNFVPNDVYLNNDGNQLVILTGPNMAGKSVYIRQIALISLLAQIGCFVPAEEAKLSIVDKIFVRSGASDVITSGLSTFMVEMVETAYILNHATTASLIVLDEIGRGTSTFDGISIAWAVAEYLVSNGKVLPKTLFATHYHELQDLEKEYPDKIKNFQVKIDDRGGNPVFLHTVVRGGASHSYGVAVAKLAGLPPEVINRATEILNDLESRDFEKWLKGEKPMDREDSTP